MKKHFLTATMAVVSSAVSIHAIVLVIESSFRGIPEKAQVIVKGKVLAAATVDHRISVPGIMAEPFHAKHARIEVSEVLKGHLQDSVLGVLFIDDPEFGQLRVGNTYLLFLKPSNQVWTLVDYKKGAFLALEGQHVPPEGDLLARLRTECENSLEAQDRMLLLDALEVLGVIGIDATLQKIKPLLQHPDEAIRAAVAGTSLTLGDWTQVEGVTEYLDLRYERRDQVVFEGEYERRVGDFPWIGCLLSVNNRAAAVRLRNILQTAKNPMVKQALITQLSKIGFEHAGPDRTVPVLFPLLRDQDRRLAYEAFRALCEISGKNLTMEDDFLARKDQIVEEIRRWAVEKGFLPVHSPGSPGSTP